MSYSKREILNKYEQAISILQRQKNVIEELRSENDFLTSTITNSRAGKIAEERRQLQQDIFLSERRERKALKELEEYQTKHEELTQELSIRIADVKKKQADTNSYIKKEAVKRTKKKEQELSKQYHDKERRLETEYKDKASFYEERIKILRRVVLIAIAYAILMTIIVVLGR